MTNRPSNFGLVVELTRQADAWTRGHPPAGLDYSKLVRRLAAAEVGIIWAAHNLGFWQATAAVGPEIRARAPSAIAQRAEALLEAVLELVTKNALAEPRGVAGAETRH